MRRRDGKPLWITGDQRPAKVLEPVDLDPKSGTGEYDEKWLQTLLYCHPEVFPIEQIEPGFGELISLCCELPLVLGGGRSGKLDNLFATRDGGLVLVEAKLWRNPEARRSAVAQAMDYAAAVFRLTYDDLQRAVLKARQLRKLPVASLFEIVAGESPELDGTEFHDAVCRNLDRGRAVIAIVGDGIREDIIPIANLVQSHAGYRFTFALVELAVYETPATGIRLVVPSVLAQTKLIERGVVRIEGEGQAGVRVVIESAPSSSEASTVRPMGIGEDEFFEALGQKNAAWPEMVKAFLATAEALGVYADLQGGLNLKHSSRTGRPLNMATITRGGGVDTGPAGWSDRGSPGKAYNEVVAKLIGGVVAESKGGYWVRTAAGKLPRLPDLLPAHEQEWLDAMDQYIRDCLASVSYPAPSTAEASTRTGRNLMVLCPRFQRCPARVA
jgi:hypothetical protein